ncbi:MAG: hypothetical protein HYV07_01275 [Deltaproteobacteria bacterium]|nr:hypothetical protein [Deltaproteobacteria bacterium]
MRPVATHGLVGPFPCELPALPSVGPVVSSSVAITVPQSGLQRLAPGSFGAVDVQHAAVLELAIPSTCSGWAKTLEAAPVGMTLLSRIRVGPHERG